MLINQATCTIPNVAKFMVVFVFDVYGNRTSASDSAVATLKEKGYIIKVNGTTL